MWSSDEQEKVYCHNISLKKDLIATKKSMINSHHHEQGSVGDKTEQQGHSASIFYNILHSFSRNVATVQEKGPSTLRPTEERRRTPPTPWSRTVETSMSTTSRTQGFATQSIVENKIWQKGQHRSSTRSYSVWSPDDYLFFDIVHLLFLNKI